MIQEERVKTEKKTRMKSLRLSKFVVIKSLLTLILLLGPVLILSIKFPPTLKENKLLAALMRQTLSSFNFPAFSSLVSFNC